MNTFLQFLLIMVCYVLGDIPFLMYNKNNYIRIVKQIQGSGLTDRYYAGFFIYVALAIGLLYLVIPRINNLKDALFYGAIFGLATYSTFDMSIHLMLHAYDLKTAVIDIIWGMILSAGVAAVVWKITN